MVKRAFRDIVVAVHVVTMTIDRYHGSHLSHWQFECNVNARID